LKDLTQNFILQLYEFSGPKIAFLMSVIFDYLHLNCLRIFADKTDEISERKAIILINFNYLSGNAGRASGDASGATIGERAGKISARQVKEEETKIQFFAVAKPRPEGIQTTQILGV